MSDQPPFDPRAVANLMLDMAERLSIALDHFALHKLLYFAHGFALRTGKPLVKGGFEAWKHGPVQPAVWQCFRNLGSVVLISRATRTDPITGVKVEVEPPDSEFAREVVHRVLHLYGAMPSNRLIELSHAAGAPWDVTVNKAKTSVALGLKIPDTLINERFARHKVSVEAKSQENPDEDTPIT